MSDETQETPDDSNMIYELHVQLDGVEPLVWRRLQIPARLSLGALHFAIQHAMGWAQRHPFVFVVGDQLYSFPDNEVEHPESSALSEASEISIAQVFADHERIGYVYAPTGDNWPHWIEVKERLEPGLGVHYPQCVNGETTCPPEGSGGIEHYSKMMHFLQQNGALPEDDPYYGNWEPDQFEAGMFIPQPRALEAMARQSARPHFHFTGHGDEFQGMATRTATRCHEDHDEVPE